MIDDQRLNDARLKDIDQRIDSSLNFFRPLAKRNRLGYVGLGTMQILLGAAIPILALYFKTDQIFAALAGALVAIVKGIETLSKPQETWLRASATISRLYSERALFRAHAGPYASVKDGIARYAENIDTVLSAENAQWQQTYARAGDQANSPATG